MTFIKETISTLRVAFDGFADCIPVLSTVNNLIDLFQKWVWQGKVLQSDPRDAYYTHLKEKNNSDCVWLLIPVIGNIYVHLKPKPPMSLEKFDALPNSRKYDYAAKQLGCGNDAFFKRLTGEEQLFILRREPLLLGKIDPDEYEICKGRAVNQILDQGTSDEVRLLIVDQQPKYLLLSEIVKNRFKTRFDEKFDTFSDQEKIEWVRGAMKYDCDDWLIKLSLEQQYEIIFPSSLQEECPRDFSNADYIKFFNEIFKENPAKIKDLSQDNQKKTIVELRNKLNRISNPNLENPLRSDSSYQLIKSLELYVEIETK